MNVTSLKDILKSLVQSLQISTSFPALAFVTFNIFCVFPGLWPTADWKLTNELLTFLAAMSVVMLSYTLYTFNPSLIRFAEGYWTKGHWIDDWPWLRELEQHFCNQQIDNYRRYRRAKSTSSAGRNAARICDTFYPSNPADILPTALGNAIAAFEDYPYTRYGIDAVALWPRLVPILKEKKYLEFVAEQKAHFDFMLNMTLVIFVCGVEFF